MVVFDNGLYRTAVVLFDENPSLEGIDIIRHLQRSKPLPGARCERSHTLIIDLTQSSESLIAAMRKDTRYEIRRAEQKDQIICNELDARDPAVLNNFIEAYDRFASAKQLAKCDRGSLVGYSNAGSLEVSTAVAPDGRVLVWHVYIVGGHRARLLHSASVVRLVDDRDTNALIGRANRFLHWEDIRRFKNRGYHQYDLGGYAIDAEDEAIRQVSRFKESFGGVSTCDYNCVWGATLKGKALLLLERAYALLQSVRPLPRFLW